MVVAEVPLDPWRAHRRRGDPLHGSAARQDRDPGRGVVPTWAADGHAGVVHDRGGQHRRLR
ncbi:hypothetical protein ABI214_15145 [Prescottella soli]|uniref:hypothetical protein n=1 Tax=Prescottella soli TaxID=1543852 RepID=UPI0032AF7E12